MKVSERGKGWVALMVFGSVYLMVYYLVHWRVVLMVQLMDILKAAMKES